MRWGTACAGCSTAGEASQQAGDLPIHSSSKFLVADIKALLLQNRLAQVQTCVGMLMHVDALPSESLACAIQRAPDHHAGTHTCQGMT